MCLVVRAGREVNVLAAAAAPVVARDQTPETIDDDWAAAGAGQLAEETGGRRVGVEHVYRSIAEVADQQVAGEPGERRRRNRQSPRRVERARRADSSQEAPLQVERGHEAVAGACDVVVFGGVLQRVGHVDPAAEGLDVN